MSFGGARRRLPLRKQHAIGALHVDVSGPLRSECPAHALLGLFVRIGPVKNDNAGEHTHWLCADSHPFQLSASKDAGDLAVTTAHGERLPDLAQHKFGCMPRLSHGCRCFWRGRGRGFDVVLCLAHQLPLANRLDVASLNSRLNSLIYRSRFLRKALSKSSMACTFLTLSGKEPK